MSRPAIKLIGQRIGRLTVLSRAEGSKAGCALWLCRCDCSTEIVLSTRELTKGRVSCGCATRGRPAQDMTGQRFGHVVVLRVGSRRNGHRLWVCRCNCGKEWEAYGRDLRRGETKSCGCQRVKHLDGHRPKGRGTRGRFLAKPKVAQPAGKPRRRTPAPPSQPFSMFAGRDEAAAQRAVEKRNTGGGFTL